MSHGRSTDDQHEDTVASEDSPSSSAPRAARQAVVRGTDPAEIQRSVEVDPRLPKMALADRMLIKEVVDGGGMAEIRRSFDANLMRTSAVKVLRSDYQDEENIQRRLIEEAQIMAQLDHPNIVPVHELGLDDEGNLFFSMKLVQGTNLRRLLAEQELATRTKAQLFDLLQIFLKVCDAVAFANSRGVFHRDIKPDNIMVGEFGEVYVMDWGIALLKDQARPSALDRELPAAARSAPRYRSADEDGMVIGTPGYMAPEQARGDIDAIDERTDVYSLGAILYTILTLAPPHFGRTSQELLVNTLTAPVIPPQELVDVELPAPLCQIAMQALSTALDERQSSALVLQRQIEEFLQSGWLLDTRRYGAGQYMIRQGETGTEAYIIKHGRCRAFKTIDGEEIELREMGPGDVFGETAVLTDEPRSASVVALEPVTVVVVTCEQLEEELDSGFALGPFAKTLARRFREKDTRSTELELELDENALAVRVLKFLVFAGHKVGDDRLEASWRELCEVFAESYGRSADKITAVVERMSVFEIDRARDLIALNRYC